MTPKKEPPIASADDLSSLARALVEGLSRKGKKLSTAESCTGGLLAKLVTDIPGSSAAFEGSVVAYQNKVKTALLGVPNEIIAEKTEVSAECAVSMADGAASRFSTDYALSTTGYAGPGGGTEKHPVGTVFIGFHTPKTTTAVCIACPNASRDEVRKRAAQTAFSMMLLELGKK